MNLSDRVRANVRFFLEAKGWAYGDLGFPRQYVCHFLRGDYGASAERIQAFADRLHVDVADLCKERPACSPIASVRSAPCASPSVSASTLW